MKSYMLIAIILITIWSCNVGPKAINYGADACHYCSMTIVDRQHASQLVTEKGKVFKFDATECMMNHANEVDRQSIAMFLANDYNMPGELIDATKATFLISKNIPSPMGEYLTAFSNQTKAQTAQIENGGELLTWEELQKRFTN
ncbi:nitrous oxide reductase accessory protein NosL [Maribacter sp. CXY002]|uniref:nitrous oxide reductase accessory protein NosL n=1 Tax=Maribacter luteocoastalis TaxID=3407671 RepID=UPI003B66BAE3